MRQIWEVGHCGHALSLEVAGSGHAKHTGAGGTAEDNRYRELMTIVGVESEKGRLRWGKKSP